LEHQLTHLEITVSSARILKMFLFLPQVSCLCKSVEISITGLNFHVVFFLSFLFMILHGLIFIFLLTVTFSLGDQKVALVAKT